MPIPALREKPQLPPDLTAVLDAFDFLSLSRPVGFTLAPIPLVEIHTYASVFPIAMPVHEFVDLIRTVDVRHLAHLKKHDGPHQNTRSRH